MDSKTPSAPLAGSTTYWKGDAAKYTGKVEHRYGGVFYEIEMLEGHLKGQTRLSSENVRNGVYYSK